MALAEAELRAPFAGAIAALASKAGEYVAPGTPVEATFDAIPGLKLLGKVSRVRALGENKQPPPSRFL